MAGVSLDFLDPLARDLVVKALTAVVDHADIHLNRFQVLPAKAGEGFEYFVGLRSAGTPTPFPQYHRLSADIASRLQYHGLAEVERAPGAPSGWFRFTDAALAWYHAHGGPTDHEVQARIGRALFDRYPQTAGGPEKAHLIREVGLAEERVDRNLNILVELHFVRLNSYGWSPGGPPPAPRTY